MIDINADNILNQDLLKEIEAKCTQDDLANCESICPLHIDSKGFLKHIENKEFDLAYKIYAKRVPFPMIVSKLCEAPCQGSCKRKNLGGSIKIQELEEFVVKNNIKYNVPPFFPKKNKKVIVLGAGLKGMTVALELAKKGYEIEIFEKNKLAGNLWENEKLPKVDLEDSIEYFLKFPIKVTYEKVEINSKDEAEKFAEINNVDALYISFETALFDKAHHLTGQINDSLIFTGSRNIANRDMIINQVYDAKTIALTLDRYLAKVSLMAGREKEQPYKTSLFTNLENIETVEEITEISSDENASKEAMRCLQCECLECVKACKYMQEYETYPKAMAREIFNNLSIAMGIHHANKLIGTCNICGQCSAICPNGLAIDKMIVAARQKMQRQEKMPESYYDFAVKDMQYSMSDNFFMAKNQKGYDMSKYLYFPSCQLAASEVNLVEYSYLDLTKRLDGGVGIILSCCGIMADWAGEESIYKESSNKIKNAWIQMGKPRIITSCPTCKSTLSKIIDEDVLGIWEIFNHEKHLLNQIDVKEKISIHDACGSRFNAKTQDEIREILSYIGYEIEEAKYNKDSSPCCGYGGLSQFVNADLADKITKFAKEEHKGKVLTYCINCRDRFIKNGSDVVHFLELIYDEKVDFVHKYPTWSERQENRRKTKINLSKIWGENIVDNKSLNLIISPEIEKTLEKRMILKSDIEKIILNAEKTNAFFIDNKTGYMISSLRISSVTFWIVYTKEKNEYIIHNAYSHRMKIVK